MLHTGWKNGLAALLLLAATTSVTAKIPTTFPADYAGKQILTASFTFTYRHQAVRTTRRIAGTGTIVFDSATAMHFEPPYSGGTASATVAPAGRSKCAFTYDSATTTLLHDEYFKQLIDGGVLRSTDSFQLTFGTGSLLFSKGVARITGRQALRYKALRNGKTVLRGTGTLTWSGKQVG